MYLNNFQFECQFVQQKNIIEPIFNIVKVNTKLEFMKNMESLVIKI